MPLQAIRISLTVGCLVFIHVAILHGAYRLAVAAGLIYSVINFAIVWVTADKRRLQSPWLVPVVLMVAAQIAIWCGYTSAVALVLAPSVVMNAMLFILFGHTLLRGREPLITRFRRLEEGYVSPKFVSYTKSLTVLWAVLFAIATIISVVAALWGDTAVWSWVSLIAIPAASLSFFLGEHVYRALRYGPEGRSSPMRTLAVVFRAEAWRESPISQPELHGTFHE